MGNNEFALVSQSGKLIRKLNSDVQATQLIDDLRSIDATQDHIFMIVGKDESEPNHTSDGIRQPADGLPKPSR
jgi:hypothetical protein